MNKLAKEAGFSQASTDRWKKGSLPNTDALIKICKYLNVSADYLLDLNDETPPPMSNQEQQLLEYFRQCDDGTQKSILLLARSGAEEAETKKLLTSQNIG
jgi:transcriptional regulator with XRE-family HTH domain